MIEQFVADDQTGELTVHYRTQVVDPTNQKPIRSVPKTSVLTGFDGIGARADRVVVTPTPKAAAQHILPSKLSPINLFQAFEFD